MVDRNTQPTAKGQASSDVFQNVSEFEVFEGDSDSATPESGEMQSPVWESLGDRDIDVGRMEHQLIDLSARGASPTGGDLDSDPYLAEVAGDESIGGTSPTPDQNVVEDLAVSAGISIPDRTRLHTAEILQQRDIHRWELELSSAEDYPEREE
jgi:Family of unknown function (DUF6335)